MKRLGKLFSMGFKDESGAVLIIVALSMVVLLGMTALVVDVGSLYQARRQVVNAADAAALAGARELPFNTVKAAERAREYAKLNYELTDDQIHIEFPTAYNNRRIVVYLGGHEEANKLVKQTFFATVLSPDFKEVEISAMAAAERLLFWEMNPAIVSFLDEPNALEIKGTVVVQTDEDILFHSNGGLETKDDLVKTGDGGIYGTAVGKLDDYAGLFNNTESPVDPLMPPLTAENIEDYLSYWEAEGLSVYREPNNLEVAGNTVIDWGAYDIVYVTGDIEIKEDGQIIGGAFIILNSKIEITDNGLLEGSIYCLEGNHTGIEFKESSSYEADGAIVGLLMSNQKIEFKNETMITIPEGVFNNKPVLFQNRARLVE